MTFVRPFALSLLLSSAGVAAGCGNTVDPADGGGGSGAQASTGDNPCYPDSCNGPTSGPTSGVSTGGDVPCGEGGSMCPTGLFCDFGGDDCGKTPGFVPDVCRVIPTECEGLDTPTCGCDGHIHMSNCQVNMLGLDVATQGLCTPPQGQFACGEHFCNANEYCENFSEGAVNTHTCKLIPDTCNDQGEPDCDCVKAGAQCPGTCNTDGNGHFIVQCTM